MTWVPRRILLVAVAAVAGAGSGPAPAAEPAPAPRAVYPRFDLTYLTRVGPQGLVGFRPAEIARYSNGPELGIGARQLFQLVFDHVLDGDPDAAAPPAFADIEQCVFDLQVRITAPSGGKRGSMAVGGVTPCVIKGVRPINWGGLLRSWFPRATTGRHAGRSYVCLPCHGLPKGVNPFAAFVADDRTLVLGAESQLHTLLDRLAAGRPAPTPPPGWAEIDREFFALAFDNRHVPLVHGKPPPLDQPGMEEVQALIDGVRTMSVGVSVGSRSGVRVVVTAQDERHAKVMAYSARRLLELAGEADHRPGHDGAFEELAGEILKNAVVERSGLRISGTTSAKGNPVEMIIAALHGPD